MQNTYLPLDMLFIRPDGSIARIAANAEPLSTRTIPSGEPVLAVLELNGGTAARLGIKAGDQSITPLPALIGAFACGSGIPHGSQRRSDG